MKTMIRRMPGARVACGLLLALLLHGGALLAQEAADPLAEVKDRYATAAYEGALTLLDGMKPAEADTAIRAEIEKYRALCFLALGKKADAEGAIERFVALDPEFPADKLDASSWVRDAFRNVRRRALPGIITKRYDEAKKNVLAKSYEVAVPQLKGVLRLLDDADLSGAEAQWRSDLRTLTQGFLDLADAAPPPAPPPAPKPAEPQPAAVPAVSDRVLPPTPIREDLPGWPQEFTARGVIPREGVVEVNIDEKGAVTSVVIRVSVYPLYDSLVKAAALKWQYKPATKGGVAVASTRRIRVVVNIGSGGAGVKLG